ncbi:MAG: glutamine--fructose-6-phosphate transaminase (isomerizing) [Candidatus Babeliales bacterium]
MCGVVGYIGKQSSRAIVIEGLQRLEYRGYDSAGFACLNNQKISCLKATGQLANLIHKLEEESIDGLVGIGHTRWATHGAISDSNAHPQFDCKKNIAVVHNGIIENYNHIKQKLMATGHEFISQTDTEVIAHLFEAINQETLLEDIQTIITQLSGAYACMVINIQIPDTIIAIRKGSPLCIGVGENEKFIGSDPFAFARYTNKVIFLPDESIALIEKDAVSIYHFNGQKITMPITQVDIDWRDNEKNGYDHYMLKEIHEQKSSIHATLSYCRSLGAEKIWDQLQISRDKIKNLRSLCLIGCGTSWHAGRIAQFFFEQICQIPTRVLLASECRYIPFFPEENSVYIGISQSGETADTLECLRLINSFDLITLSVTNVSSSTMARETNGFLLTKAGQEIAVASTKAFSTQLVVLYWLAHYIALEKNLITSDQVNKAYDDLLITAEILESTIEKYKYIIENKLAPYYAQFKRFIFLGRHISYPFAMEAALKLKEISYIFSQCYPAGELKHGPIALLDKETPVVLFSNLEDHIYQKVLSNAQEVKARDAHIIAFVFEGQEELQNLADFSFVIPRVNPLLAPLAMTGLMQFWVYQIAKELGCPIDKPRNLAKSVTVE